MYSVSDLKRGLVIDFEGAPHQVESTQASSPSARGGNTITRVKMRNLLTKQRVDKSFRGGETFGVPNLEKRPVSYMYDDPDGMHFMDDESFDQFMLTRESLEWEANFLVEGLAGVRAMFLDGTPVGLELPHHVDLEITECNPGVKGNSATGRTKPATLQTGHVVQVPEHVEQGTRVTVDTRTGEFLGRAKA